MEFFVLIPLPPFLCQIRFGDRGSDWQGRFRQIAVTADMGRTPRRESAAWANVLCGRRELRWLADSRVLRVIFPPPRIFFAAAPPQFEPCTFELPLSFEL